MPELSYLLTKEVLAGGEEQSYSRLLITCSSAEEAKRLQTLFSDRPHGMECSLLNKKTIEEYNQKGPFVLNILVNVKKHEAPKNPGYNLNEAVTTILKAGIDDLVINKDFLKNLEEGYNFKKTKANLLVAIFKLEKAKTINTYAEFSTFIKGAGSSDEFLDLENVDGFAEFEDCDKLEAQIKEEVKRKSSKDTKNADVKPGFNPFIHGTTCAAFASMSKTNNQLMPVLTMLDDYQAAPMVGELTQGGYKFLGLKLAKEEVVGATSFGKVFGCNYDLKKITANYTNFKAASSDNSVEEFRDILKYGIYDAFSKLNLMLIYFTRARQMDKSIDDLLSKEELNTLRGQLHATVQFYYFIQLLGSDIHPNFDAIGSVSSVSKASPPLTDHDISDAVYTHLTFENIVNKIIQHKIDIKDTVLNRNEEKLTKVLGILELPQKSIIKSGIFYQNDKDIELPFTQFFRLEKHEVIQKEDTKPCDGIGYFFQNHSSDSINLVLKKFLNCQLEDNYFQSMAKDANIYISAFEDRIRLFEKLIAAPQERVKFTAEQHDLLKWSFPIIFVSESEHIKAYLNEYRSQLPLKLGTDIPMIATDSETHKEQVKKYLRDHQVDPVQVVLFSDLEHARVTKDELPLSINTQALRTMLTATSRSKHDKLFYSFYALLDDLNEKRNRFRNTDPVVFNAMDELLKKIDGEMNTAFSIDKPVTSGAVRKFSESCRALIQGQKTVFEHHRGILGILDTALTILASLIILYPIVYWHQKANNIQHTFFNTDTGTRAQRTIDALTQMENAAADFP